ncbi:hypothetical protein PFLUV_G00056310 [Perca fluviatilis]|uniref:Secreted protein n=1 Tax=Perca fluviatilis TaxID=8168 RepID=A0A6A5FCT4_PERFL|nr:hypothetical protein PFLUV_G00056310 [Perca fluviatilis]
MRTDFALVLTAALLLDTFWRNNGEHASKDPCRPGFSQSFYSVLISRDVLQSQGIRKAQLSCIVLLWAHNSSFVGRQCLRQLHGIYFSLSLVVRDLAGNTAV